MTSFFPPQILQPLYALLAHPGGNFKADQETY
jgi:hypothetical protein